MRVDLDELDRLDYANCKACVCMGGCSDLLEAIPDLIAELRAARECVAVLREYQWGGDTEWCDACKCHEGRHNSDCAIEGALLAYDAAVKGDG